MRVTAEALWLVWLTLFVSGVTGLALFYALFVEMPEPQKVPPYVRHFRAFGVALVYGGILLVATAYLGLFADVAARAFGVGR